MRHYDGVVITASFKPEFHHRSALTVPVELSECYASGTVTVVIAPPYSAVSQFVQLYGGGLAVGAVADAVERQAIRRLKSDSTRRPILEVARQVWHEQCASAVMHRRWRDAWSGETRNSHASNTPSRA
jgi:hypothetical protein